MQSCCKGRFCCSLFAFRHRLPRVFRIPLHWAHTPSHFVIPTEAKRSGGTCCSSGRCLECLPTRLCHPDRGLTRLQTSAAFALVRMVRPEWRDLRFPRSRFTAGDHRSLDSARDDNCKIGMDHFAPTEAKRSGETCCSAGRRSKPTTRRWRCPFWRRARSQKRRAFSARLH